MAEVKLTVWNMEWMNKLFVGDEEARSGGVKLKDTKEVRDRRKDLAAVIGELSPDALVVVEGPNRTEELQLFFDTDVRGNWKTYVQPARGAQAIGIATRIDGGKFRDPPFTAFDTKNIEKFKQFGTFYIDTDDDEIDEQHHFERYPLYAAIHLADGKEFRVLGLHLKSKVITNALEWGKWWQKAGANRKKLIAQTLQVRTEFLDPYLEEDETKDVPLIVCGDINDGPGMDASEKLLFASAVETLTGTIWKPELCLGNAVFDNLTAKEKEKLDFADVSTTRFKDPIFNDVYHRVWIDHILYTKGRGAGGGGAPWVTGGTINYRMADGSYIWEKYPHASDHHPVSALVDLG
jgi:hypothetical protein